MKAFERSGPSLLAQRWRLLKVETKREVGAGPEAVWAVLRDHTTWTEWHEDYDEHEALTDRTSAVGARFRTKEGPFRYESEVVRWEEGVVMGTTITSAKHLHWLFRRYYSEITIEPIDGVPDSCTVHYRTAFTGTWTFWLLSAYTVGQSLGSVYFDTRSSLKGLDRYLRAER